MADSSLMLTIFCIATYRKGDEFLRECRRAGARVLQLTDETLSTADWPRDAIDEFYYVRREMPDADIRKGLAFVARTERIDRIVALDDFDVELAAMLREYLRIPGMGTTTARSFRDKLAMRTGARGAGIPCPEFVHVLSHAAIGEWLARVPGPWVLKPRAQAAAIGSSRHRAPRASPSCSTSTWRASTRTSTRRPRRSIVRSTEPAASCQLPAVSAQPKQRRAEAGDEPAETTDG